MLDEAVVVVRGGRGGVRGAGAHREGGVLLHGEPRGGLWGGPGGHSVGAQGVLARAVVVHVLGRGTVTTFNASA